MKKELQFLNQKWLIFICFLFSLSVQAQVLNGSTYNIEAHFMKGRYSMNTGTTNARVSFVGKIVNGTNVIQNQLLDYNFEATNPTAMCYSYIGVEGPSGFLYGPDDEKNMGTLLNSPTYNFDFEVRSWRDYSSVSNTNSAVRYANLAARFTVIDLIKFFETKGNFVTLSLGSRSEFFSKQI